MAGFAWAGVVLRRAAVLHAGRQLAARRRRDRAEQHAWAAARWSATTRSWCDISTEDERDRVSSRGWAFGYLGGGLLLVRQPGVVPRPRRARARRRGMAVRLSLLSAALWWAGVHDHPAACGCATTRPQHVVPEPGSAVPAQLRPALRRRCRSMRDYPMTLTFLVAYLFYNDGIQTVIDAASTYGSKQLGFGQIGADRDDPADPVRGVRRRAALRPARRQVRRLPVDPVAAPTPGW